MENSEKLFEKEKISPPVLKLVNNFLCILDKIDPRKYRIPLRFIFGILLKFSLLSPETRHYLAQKTIFIQLLNYIILKDDVRGIRNPFYVNYGTGLVKVNHELLNPDPFDSVMGENNPRDKFIELNYDYMLLCNLIFYSEKPKEKMDDEDKGTSFWSQNYIYHM